MAAVAEARIDWFQVISMLSRAGYSLGSIAAAVGVARTTLIGWKQGAEPRYSEGDRLVSFWCQITNGERHALPTCTASDWWAYHSK